MYLVFGDRSAIESVDDWPREMVRAAFLVALAVFAATTIIVVLAEDTDAWTQSYVFGEEGNYRSGHVYYNYVRTPSYGSGEYHKDPFTNPYLYYYYYSYAWNDYYYYYYRPYIGMKVGSLDDRTYVDSAYLYCYVSTENNWDDYVAVVQLHFDAQVTDANQLYEGYGSAADFLGSVYVGSSGYFSIQITGNALTYLRNAIKGADDYIYYGLAYESSSGDYLIIDPSNCYLYLLVDREAPNPPAVSSLNAYSWGSSVTISWSAPNDNPPTPNVGLASMCYEVGVFESYSSEPSRLFGLISSGTTSYTIGPLADGTRYWFRVRARDASGFISQWSAAQATIMDASPPSIPVLEAEPTYTEGTSNVVEWAPSVDAGIGTLYYQVQRSTSADFASAVTDVAYTTSYTYSSLTNEQKYYFRARSVDNFGYASEWSVPQFSTQDDAAPLAPHVMVEPPFTPTNMNTFEWYPSRDAGVGVAGYRVQVSTTGSFTAGTLIVDSAVSGIWLSVGPLADATTYFFRVSAYDHFGYTSGWSGITSSTQDASGPSQPGLAQLPRYSPDAPLELSWQGSADEGAGVNRYTVEWSTDARFMANFHQRDYVLGNSQTVTDLTPGRTWYLRVRAWDNVGNVGPFDTVNTTIDGTAPTAPAIDAEPAFTDGLENTITWTAATDELAGVDHYMVRVYGRAGGSGLVFTDTTDALTMTIPGLADGATYWYEVVAVDGAGNVNGSALAMSTQDASPPTVPRLDALPPFIPGTSLSLGWSASTDRGAGGVEYQLEWATDALFSDLVGTTAWLASPGYDVGDLADGTTYHFRARARDALGLESLWSDTTMTTVDASPPAVPEFDVPGTFVPGPAVHLSWSRVADGSGEPVEYVVMALDSAQTSATIIGTSPWLSVTSFDYAELPTDVEVFFRVVARDALGHQSERSGAVASTIDTKGPAAATIMVLPAYTKGTAVKLTWTAAVDAGIGQVEHRVIAFSDEDLGSRAFTSDWTSGTTADVTGLADGLRYWFAVDCRDGFGNAGARSEVASTTMDASPPSVTVDAPGYFGPADGSVSGTCADTGSGVSSVDASSDSGETWVGAELSGGTWSVGLDALGTDVTEVWVRARDAVGNVLGTYGRAVVDSRPPTIAVTMPMAGATVSGAVMVLGSISDPHLAGYVVEARRAGESAWSTVQPYQATTGVAGTLATWVTAGLPGGDWTLRVTATDAVGLSSQFELAVTLKGAHLTIGPGDISFSDSHPLPGDTVTVLVTVRNDGDSPADDMTVVLYDGEKEVGRGTTSVQAHGVAVVPIKVKVSGSHEFTARATSSLYDTGEMPVAQPLQTIEEEATLENAGGILGLVALILAVLCLLLILLNMRKGKAAPARAAPPREDIILEPMQ